MEELDVEEDMVVIPRRELDEIKEEIKKLKEAIRNLDIAHSNLKQHVEDPDWDG